MGQGSWLRFRRSRRQWLERDRPGGRAVGLPRGAHRWPHEKRQRRRAIVAADPGNPGISTKTAVMQRPGDKRPSVELAVRRVRAAIVGAR